MENDLDGLPLAWSYFDKVWQRAEDISCRSEKEVQAIASYWRSRIEEAGRKGWHPTKTAEAIWDKWVFDGPPYTSEDEGGE